jgi:hypothetical protein
MLSNLTILDGPVVSKSYGVDVIHGGTATVFRSAIDGGRATLESIGVRSVGARVLVQDNCSAPPSLQTGNCSAGCTDSAPSIAGPTQKLASVGAAVLLEASPGSRVERSSLCERSDTDGVPLRVRGDAAGVVVRGNVVQKSARAGVSSATHEAVMIDACEGAAPWLVSNDVETAINGGDDDHARGVFAQGNCHPVVQANSSWVRIDAASGLLATGLECAASGGVASQCVVVGNARIGASVSAVNAGNGVYLRGLACSGGSCSKIANNGMIGTGAGNISRSTSLGSVGLVLDGSVALVDRNTIAASCARYSSTIGVQVTGAANVRIQNNYLLGGEGACPAPTDFGGGPYQMVGLWVDDGSSVDVSSNYISGSDPQNGHFSTEYPLYGVVGGGTGTYRNNVLRAGRGGNGNSRAFLEKSDPIAFQNNLLYVDVGWSRDGGPYEHDLDHLSAAQVNELPGASGNVDDCAPLTPDPPFELQNGSACIDGGFVAGAPLRDFSGYPRDAVPDIGPVEYRALP